jgi:hypothetical protein
MNAQKGREQRRRSLLENGEPLDDKMISSLVSKVKRFRWCYCEFHDEPPSQNKVEGVPNGTA